MSQITWDVLQALIDDTTARLTEVEESVLDSYDPAMAKQRGFVELRRAVRAVLDQLTGLAADMEPEAPVDPALAATGDDEDPPVAFLLPGETLAEHEVEELAAKTVLHVTANVEIEDGQEGRFVIGHMEDDDRPWWVVDREPKTSETGKPVSVFAFAKKADATEFRDALNTGDTDRAARIRAAEDQRQRAAEAADEELPF